MAMAQASSTKPMRSSPRSLCAAGALALHLGLGALIIWQGRAAPTVVGEVSTPVVIDMTLGAPPQPVSEPAAATKAEETPPKPEAPDSPQPPAPPKFKARPVVVPDAPTTTVRQAAPSSPMRVQAPASAPASSSASPAPSVPAPSAPPVPQAPPAARATRSSAMTWDSQVMAHLERHRRYPSSAQRRGLEGVAKVRFKMDRQGRVLWSRLEASSGHAELDRAAVETPRRAQPLPAIPAGMPDQVERVVAIDFYL